MKRAAPERNNGLNRREFMASQVTVEQWFHAVSANNLITMKRALDQGFDVDSVSSGSFGSGTALEKVLESPRISVNMLHFLLQHGAATKKKFFNALCKAVDRKSLPAVKELIETGGMDPNSASHTKTTALQSACLDQSWEIARYLIEHGAVLTPVCFCRFKDDDLFNWMMERAPGEPEFRQEVFRLLCQAICRKCGVVGKLRLMVDKWGVKPSEMKADPILEIDYHFLGEWSPAESREAINYLRELGCDVNAKSKQDGMTLFHLTARDGRKSLLKILAQSGADVFRTDDYGRNALHHALLRRDTPWDIVEYLVRGCKLDVNARNAFGKTAVHYAAEKRSTEFLEYLVDECDGDLTIADDEGQRPGAASECGNIREFLKNRQAL